MIVVASFAFVVFVVLHCCVACNAPPLVPLYLHISNLLYPSLKCVVKVGNKTKAARTGVPL